MNGSITGNLNSKDGKLRLNVAISKAKNKIILITSLKSNELPPSDEGEGRSLLKFYLDYCEAIALNYKESAKQILDKVCSNKNIDNSKDESPLETQIREANGATYHSGKIAKERDLYRQQLLERKGWTFIRIWSKDWWNNKEREIEKVLNKINELTKE